MPCPRSQGKLGCKKARGPEDEKKELLDLLYKAYGMPSLASAGMFLVDLLGWRPALAPVWLLGASSRTLSTPIPGSTKAG